MVPIANWASLLEAKKDLARHLGKSYQLETTRFAGTPQMNEFAPSSLLQTLAYRLAFAGTGSSG